MMNCNFFDFIHSMIEYVGVDKFFNFRWVELSGGYAENMYSDVK